VEKGAILRKAVKAIAGAIGLVATLLCLMAVVGLLASSGWVRAPVAIVIAVVLPAVIADRLLPDEPGPATKGLATDVFALGWLTFPVLFALVLGGVTRGMLATEGDRLAASGMGPLARGAWLLAGVRPEAAPAAASTAPEPSGSGSATTTASATVTTAPSIVPTASGSVEPPPPAPPSSTEPTAAEIFKKLAPAVVTVTVKGHGHEGGGTGFVIDKSGTVVTNHHVIDGASEGSIKFMNGAYYEDVWVLADEATADLALLHIDIDKPKEGERPELTPATLGDAEKVVVGESVIVIGNPLGLEHTLTTGIVSARRTYEGRKWIQMSAPISPGNSGGPVFNGHGEVIGVATASIVGYGFAQNLNLAVPVDQLRALVKPDYPGKRKLGKGGPSTTW
jgi:serine protease Do